MPELIAEDGGIRQHQQRLQSLISNTKGIVRVASPYVTNSDLLIGAKNRKVYLLTTLSLMDIVSGSTTIDALQSLIKSGVECKNLKNYQKLHAKVYIFGNSNAVVTSANLTRNAFESNIEVGVKIEKDDVNQLKEWFDKFWDKADPIDIPQLTLLQQQTADLRRDYLKLKSKIKSKIPHVKDYLAPEVFPEDLHDLLNNASRFFVCNTDRRHGVRDSNGKYVLEQKMYSRGYATAWETFKFPSHMKQVQPGDVIFMFAKDVGIIGIGRARSTYEFLKEGHPDRIENFTDDNSPEWRVPVDWFDWRADKNAYPYKSQNATFWNVTDKKYSDLIKGIRKHFLGNS